MDPSAKNDHGIVAGARFHNKTLQNAIGTVARVLSMNARTCHTDACGNALKLPVPYDLNPKP